jgi:hypothetical protein
MIYFNSLFSPYNFREVVELTVDKIGVSSLVILVVAFIGIIVYFCTIPSKGRFSSSFSQTNAIGFFQQAFYVLSSVSILIPFFSGWIPFFVVLALYGAIVGPLFLNVLTFRKDLKFEDYLNLRKGPVLMWQKYVGIGLTWIAIIGELFFFLYFNPTIPLLGWGIIAYTFATAFLMSALTQSVLYNATTCPYCKITTSDGVTEGFIIAKGEDNYLLKTKENSDFLFSSDFVRTISPLPIPKEPLQNKLEQQSSTVKSL